MFHDDGSASSNSEAAEATPSSAGTTAPVDGNCPDAPPRSEQDDAASFIAGLRPARVYVIDRFTPLRSERETMPLALAEYRAALSQRGWRRILMTDAVTGAPGSLSQIWVGPPDLLTQKELDDVAAQPFHKALAAKMVDDIARERFIAMPYDPGPAPASEIVNEGPPNVLVVNRIAVEPGAMARFSYLKQSFFVPTLEGDLFQWRLVLAAALSTDPHIVMQIWELPDANRLSFTMQRMGQHSTYRSCLEPCIHGEDQHLYEATDWS